MYLHIDMNTPASEILICIPWKRGAKIETTLRDNKRAEKLA